MYQRIDSLYLPAIKQIRQFEKATNSMRLAASVVSKTVTNRVSNFLSTWTLTNVFLIANVSRDEFTTGQTGLPDYCIFVAKPLS